MSFSHTLSATFVCRPNVTKAQLVGALSPLSRYMGWTNEELMCDERLPEEDLVEIKEEHGQVIGFTLHSTGEVQDDFHNILIKTGESLQPLVEPAFFELHDLSTGELEFAIAKIWVGAEPALSLARRNHAWGQVHGLLTSVDYSLEEILALKKLIMSFPAPSPKEQAIRAASIPTPSISSGSGVAVQRPQG